MKFMAILLISALQTVKSFGIPKSLPTTVAKHLSTRAFSTTPHYPTLAAGASGTDTFRVFYTPPAGDATAKISPWHDIPLKPSHDSKNYNMITEIPKYTKAKFEVNTKQDFNPIAQDIKKGKLRDYHGPIFWNYGCFPQTWEDPNLVHPTLKVMGDNDPIDVVEIGSTALVCGSVTEVKALGVLAMVDDGELDWKVVAISKSDPLYELYHDIDDVPDNVKNGIREWFRWYKTPDGKPLNEFGFGGKFLDKKETKEVIEETHVAWKDLRSGKTENVGKLWKGN